MNLFIKVAGCGLFLVCFRLAWLNKEAKMPEAQYGGGLL